MSCTALVVVEEDEDLDSKLDSWGPLCRVRYVPLSEDHDFVGRWEVIRLHHHGTLPSDGFLSDGLRM